ncbi:MAG: hypothetical protein PVG25_11520, partial [Anaerolineae bacterium]
MENHLLDGITRRDFLKSTAGLCFKMGLSSIFLCSCRPDASRDETPAAVEEPTPAAVEKPADIGSGFEPAYLKLHKTGELKKRAEELWAIMESCRLCPRRCGVNRLDGMRGFCHAPGANLVVASFHPHFGEERPLVGKGG